MISESLIKHDRLLHEADHQHPLITGKQTETILCIMVLLLTEEQTDATKWFTSLLHS